MASVNLFGRAFQLIIGIPPSNTPNAATLQSIVTSAAYKDGQQGLDISGFDVEFSITRTLKPEPPSAQIKVYNLSKDNQKLLGSKKSLVVQLQAGYQGSTTLVYFGTVASAWTQRVDADEVTHLESGDGEAQFGLARLNHTTSKQGAQVQIDVALQIIVTALGVNQGNLLSALPALRKAGIQTIPGAALAGSAAKRLTDLLLSAGFSWSIQAGALQILEIVSAINPTQAILCSPDTGMIDSPSVDSKGIVNAKMLIIPGLLPGVLVTFDTKFLTGTYKVQQTHHTGQTWGDEWYVAFSGVKYAP